MDNNNRNECDDTPLDLITTSSSPEMRPTMNNVWATEAARRTKYLDAVNGADPRSAVFLIRIEEAAKRLRDPNPPSVKLVSLWHDHDFVRELCAFRRQVVQRLRRRSKRTPRN